MSWRMFWWWEGVAVEVVKLEVGVAQEPCFTTVAFGFSVGRPTNSMLAQEVLEKLRVL